MKRKLLLASSNPGKIAEMKAFLETLPFELVTLLDLGKDIVEPDETEATFEGNAIIKARYYAEKTGLLTLADDAGMCIDALLGWPGVHSARIAPEWEERTRLVLAKMQGIPDEKRTALFRDALALRDPLNDSVFVTYGETRGSILDYTKPLEHGFGYDNIFFLNDLGKTYSELSINEKNAVSHRGKALVRMKYHVQNTYTTKHIVVPFALIIKDGKILMNKRNDPHRPDYHNKWEFPGGTVEFGEATRDNVVREVKEEVGYDVEVLKLLQHIAVEGQTYPTHSYQVYLIPYVCRIIGGDGVYSDGEVLETKWFELDDVLNHNLIGENARMYEKLLPELREVVAASVV